MRDKSVVLLVTILAIVSLTAPAAAQSSDEEWLAEAEEEPPPRYGPGGTREPARTSSPAGSAMLGVGIGLTALGGGGVVAGALLGFSCLAESMATNEGCRDGAPAIGAAIGGVVGIGVGIPLIVSGVRRRERGAELVQLRFAALPGGGGLGLVGEL